MEAAQTDSAPGKHTVNRGKRTEVGGNWAGYSEFKRGEMEYLKMRAPWIHTHAYAHINTPLVSRLAVYSWSSKQLNPSGSLVDGPFWPGKNRHRNNKVTVFSLVSFTPSYFLLPPLFPYTVLTLSSDMALPQLLPSGFIPEEEGENNQSGVELTDKYVAWALEEKWCNRLLLWHCLHILLLFKLIQNQKKLFELLLILATWEKISEVNNLATRVCVEKGKAHV